MLQQQFFAGNNPVRYIDPDGKVTKHKDLKGRERLKSELKDIVQGSFKFGIFAGGSITLWDVVDVGAKPGSLSTSADDEDVKFGGEIGFCVGIGLWINLSEIKDFVKGWMNGEY